MKILSGKTLTFILLMIIAIEVIIVMGIQIVNHNRSLIISNKDKTTVTNIPTPTISSVYRQKTY